MDKSPITISAPGTDVRVADGTDVTFTTKYPFAKLDSTNGESFQNITIFFNSEPPNPVSGATTKTLLYSAPHGYKYVPSMWLLGTNTTSANDDPFVAPPFPTDGLYTIYFHWFDENLSQTQAHIAETYHLTSSVVDGLCRAWISLEADDTNYYIYVNKDALWVYGVDPFYAVLQGIFINLRVYIFVEDLLGGSVPTHA